MKPILLSLALIPLFLTGCATTGYYSDYPGYYDPGYYGPGYYGGPVVSYYSGGDYYHRNYHHYDDAYRGGYHSDRSYGFNGSHGSHFASVSATSHRSGSGSFRAASVSSGAAHTDGGNHDGGHRGHH